MNIMKLENETELNKNELNKLEAESKEKLNKIQKIARGHLCRKRFAYMRRFCVEGGYNEVMYLINDAFVLDEEEDDEREYEFSHYGNYTDTDEIIVAGGGLGNGNAYATVKVIDEFTVLYREYGKNASSVVYRDSELEYDDEGYNFDIIPNARF